MLGVGARLGASVVERGNKSENIKSICQRSLKSLKTDDERQMDFSLEPQDTLKTAAK